MWPSHEPVLLFVENLWIKLVPISGDLFPYATIYVGFTEIYVQKFNSFDSCYSCSLKNTVFMMSLFLEHESRESNEFYAIKAGGIK